MKRDVLGASQPSLPLGRNVRHGVAGPIANATTYNTRRGKGATQFVKKSKKLPSVEVSPL